jgi:hypothetical protein
MIVLVKVARVEEVSSSEVGSSGMVIFVREGAVKVCAIKAGFVEVDSGSSY